MRIFNGDYDTLERMSDVECVADPFIFQRHTVWNPQLLCYIAVVWVLCVCGCPSCHGGNCTTRASVSIPAKNEKLNTASTLVGRVWLLFGQCVPQMLRWKRECQLHLWDLKKEAFFKLLFNSNCLWRRLHQIIVFKKKLQIFQLSHVGMLISGAYQNSCHDCGAWNVTRGAQCSRIYMSQRHDEISAIPRCLSSIDYSKYDESQLG